MTKEKLYWAEDKHNAPFRFAGWCDEVVRHIRHTGWLCDAFGNDRLRGIVFRLAHGKGFVAGYGEIDWNDGAVIDVSTVYDCEISAAHAADELARVQAENNREYHEANNASEDYRDICHELTVIRRSCLRLLQEYKKTKASLPYNVREACINSVRSYCKERRTLIKKRSELFDRYSKQLGWNDY